jgi:twinkle protein
MKSIAIKTHTYCPCGDSSDAFTVYDDGHGHCFSCNKHIKDATSLLDKTTQLQVTSTTQSPNADFNEYTYQYVPLRGIRTESMEFFGIQTKVSPEGEPIAHGYFYPNGAVKIRDLKTKQFRSDGPMSEATLFGKDKFNAGGKAIVITEGELDAVSAWQMLGNYTPCVSVRSASSARKDCVTEREYINSFDRIYLCLDNDEPGQKASREIASLFDFNKVYQIQMSSFKDANEFLQANKDSVFKTAWSNASRFLPEGIISANDAVFALIDQEDIKAAATYPWDEVQNMTKGIRMQEVVLLTAMEGVGKTEIFRALEYHLLQTTESNIGIIHLEESKSRLIKGLVGYDLNTPVHLDPNVSKKEIKQSWVHTVKRDNRVHIYSHFGSDDPDVILDAIRFMASACECKYIFLDHITMLVSGLDDGDERRTLDYISTKLAHMVEEQDFCLFMISHVNDDGKTRGSRNISKIADLSIHLDRDLTVADPIERNTTKLTIRKNRFASQTGPAGQLYFDPSTFKIKPRVIPPHDLPPVSEQNF